MLTSKKLPSPRSKALPDPRVYLSVSLPYEVATQLNDLATLHETTRHNTAGYRGWCCHAGGDCG